ncbi:MAG: cytochrome-c peroxidase [Chitinophagales bacterium]|nr:cytochrome-c peroxidase [Chitinophagales bacterium]
MKNKILYISLFLFIVLIVVQCKKEENNTYNHNHVTTPYEFPNIEGFSAIPQNPNNIVTVEGVALGKKLFFDTQLSLDYTISCASCHLPEKSFAENTKFSTGVNGAIGTRNAMTLVNLAWYDAFFWDGKSLSLENQALIPVPQHNEMNLEWKFAVQRIQNDTSYKKLFNNAFGHFTVTKEDIANAIAQYEKTLISYNTPFEKYNRGEQDISASVLRGHKIFTTEKGDCFHCHSSNELFIKSDEAFANNGMDFAETTDDFVDKGLGAITGNPLDNGKFKIPTLRNLAFTAPYMHDGRFATLDEVIESYNKGPELSPSLANILKTEAQRRLQQYGHWGLELTDEEKTDLKNFLLSLSDSSYIQQ